MAVSPCSSCNDLFLVSFIFFALSIVNPSSFSQSLPPPPPHLLQRNQCGGGEKCGMFQHLPFPFHLSASCGDGSLSDAFRLTCLNSTSLYLNIGILSYQVLHFFTDAVLVDFPNTSYPCRQYNNLNSFGFEANDYFGISTDNVVGLYDCDDSSLCKADCVTVVSSGGSCDQNGSTAAGTNYHPACCYPLSDRSAWGVGDGFSVFSQFGCRGFSCWVVSPGGSGSGKRGVKLEWAIPWNLTKEACAANSQVENATAVTSGVRCHCQDGFAGDGFAQGLGCSKYWIIKTMGILKQCQLAGAMSDDNIVRHTKSGNSSQSTTLFQKACRTRLFTYHELEEATNGFANDQKLVDGTKDILYAGVLGDGSHVVVHKVQCESERDLIQVLSQVEVLSAVSHKSMARLLGCSIESEYTPLMVYEYPANGTLEENLRQSREKKIGLDWYKRLNIVAETTSLLAFLQREISPPILHNDLQSGCVLLDEDFSVKISGFGLLCASHSARTSMYNTSEGLNFHRTDVYNLGVMLLEIIAGTRPVDLPTIALKIRGGKVEEIVDPLMYYHEQSAFFREQIEKVADLATRCLLFGGDGNLGMIDVARELVHITKESARGGSRRGPALEETFSNSSLLQMISMSPDSTYVP
ncbi:hypothetical protein RJ640_006811 [Escallonia rubra]|uniref:Protein kinase domain-containing protein n=1 Tax=Escallonia rubra TaxID=112253 RepID=A0AA88RNA5_9ASTE|nr:hypothetical protein RJ640_006811 [Escallonia rubra]